MKSGIGRAVARIAVSPVIAVRTKSGLSQTQFAQLSGVSVRTLQDCEQGRLRPAGAAKTLLAIAGKRPEVRRETLAG